MCHWIHFDYGYTLIRDSQSKIKRVVFKKNHFEPRLISEPYALFWRKSNILDMSFFKKQLHMIDRFSNKTKMKEIKRVVRRNRLEDRLKSIFIILSHILKNMKAKYSSQMGLFQRFFIRCLPIGFTLNSNIGKFCSRLGENFQNSEMFVWP